MSLVKRSSSLDGNAYIFVAKKRYASTSRNEKKGAGIPLKVKALSFLPED